MKIKPLVSTVIFAIVAGSALSACRGEPPRASQPRIQAWLEAAGDSEAWREVKNARFTITTVWFDSTGTEVRRRPRYVWIKKAPERSRIERQEREGYYIQGHDGTTPWATLDGVPLPVEHKATAEALYVSRDVFYWIGLPYKLTDSGVFMQPIPEDSIGLAGVRVSFGDDVGQHPGDRYFYYFGDDSPLPVEVHYIEQGHTDVNRTRWKDFHQAGSITYVGTREWYNEQGIRTKQLIVTDVVINPGVADSLFAPPAS